MRIGVKVYCDACMRELEKDGKCPYCGYEHTVFESFCLRKGTLLDNGRYQLGALLEANGVGIDYAAWDYQMSQPVVIKELYLADICSRDTNVDNNISVSDEYKDIFTHGLERFQNETIKLASIENLKSIVSVLDCFEENNTIYMVMEYIHGVTLYAYAEMNSIDPQTLISMMKSLDDDIAVLKENGINHKNVNPSNILVQEDGTLKMIGFCSDFSDDIEPEPEPEPVQIETEVKADVLKKAPSLGKKLYSMIKGKHSLPSLSIDNEQLKKLSDKAFAKGLPFDSKDLPINMDSIQAMQDNLVLLQKIKQHRFMKITTSITSIVLLFLILFLVNSTFGYYLGNGMWYSLHPQQKGLHVHRYTGHVEKLDIPSKMLWLPVLQIDSAAFQGADDLVDVNIPGTILNIDEFAFNGCDNLRTVKLSEGVANIASCAFTECPNLQHVDVPLTLIHIEKNTFDDSSQSFMLSGLREYPISLLAKEYNIPYADIRTEENENGLTLVRYDATNGVVQIPDEINGQMITRIQSTDEETPVFPPEIHSVTLPQHLEVIGDYAFMSTQITELELPESLKEVGRYAFFQSSLTHIELPESVEHVGEGAFSECSSLESVKLSEGMKELNNACFEGDKNLKELIIPEGVENIGYLAVSKCNSLENIALPSTITTIGSHAISDCKSLKALFIPDSVKTISRSAISGCPNNLAIIGFSGNLSEYFAVHSGYSFFDMTELLEREIIGVTEDWELTTLKETEDMDTLVLPTYFMDHPMTTLKSAEGIHARRVILPGHLETIQENSFLGNTYLEQVETPNTLRDIQSHAFANCNNLREIELKEGMKTIDDSAFFGCTQLNRIILPDSVTHIEKCAFMGCQNASEIHIPTSLVYLEGDTFADTGIMEVTIPGNINKCSNAFYGCRQLQQAIIEEGVKELSGTFAECENLSSVTIPSSVTQISVTTFRNCRNLQDVWIYGDEVNFDYHCPDLNHYGNETMNLMETDESPALFSDSPNLVIHAPNDSSAHIFANEHNITFEAIQDDQTEGYEDPTYAKTDAVFTYDELLERLAIQNLDPMECWTQFQYCLGYDLGDLAMQWLDQFEGKGNDSEKNAVISTRRFLAQKAKGYATGAVIVHFQDDKEHPTLQIGDIIVKTNYLRQDNENQVYTVLRPKDNDSFETINCIIHPEDPSVETLEIAPQTFE